MMTASNPTSAAHAQPRPSRRHAGFTLIELMVALAIGLFLITVVGSLYVASRSIFFATNSATSMDENARAAFDAIGNSVRNARYRGCENISGTITGDVRADAYRDPANWWQNINQPVYGYQDLTANDPRFDVPTTVSTHGGTVDGTDALILIGVDLKREATVSASTTAAPTPPATTSTSVTLTTTLKHSYGPGQILIGSDCATTAYFVADGNTNGDASQIGYSATGGYDCSIDLAVASCGGATVATPHTFQAGALVLPVVAEGYFIAASASDAANKGNSLWLTTTDPALGGSSSALTPVELVNGIENMYIEYGVASGGAITYSTANAVPDWSSISALKVHLLLATLPDARTSSVGSNAITFKGATFTPTDKRIYREYIQVFSLRN